MYMPPKITFFLFLLATTFLQAQEIDFNHYNKGIEQKNEANYEAAILNFNSFINSYPKEYPDVYFHRAHAYWYLKNYTKAIADFEHFHQLATPKRESTYALGRIYFKLRDYNNAIQYFTKTIAIDPFNAPAYNERGLTLCQLRKYDESLSDFHKATALDTNFAMAYNNLGAARYFKQDIAKPTQKDLHFATNWFSMAIEKDPTLALAYRNRAAMQILLQEYEAALVDLSKATQLSPYDAMIYFYLGVAYADRGEHSQSIASFNKALQQNPNLPFAYEEMGNLHKSQGDYQQAIKRYRQAQKVRKSQLYIGLMDYRIALVYGEQENADKMFMALRDAKKNKVFKDMRVYQDFLKAKEFRKYRSKKKLRKFTKSISKGEKDNKFLNPDLGWFRMRK